MDRDEWLDPDDDMGIWEHQGHPLSTRSLMAVLAEVDDVPVEVEFYDGTEVRMLTVVHIDLRGRGGRATAAVLTVS
jgi:hypothetical protein